MRYALYQFILKGVREGPVANIVEQDGAKQSFLFRLAYFEALFAQKRYRLLHEVHGAKGMVKTGMVRPRVDQVAEPHLRDAPESLEIRVFDQL